MELYYSLSIDLCLHFVHGIGISESYIYKISANEAYYSKTKKQTKILTREWFEENFMRNRSARKQKHPLWIGGTIYCIQ